jgi:amino-acid N-acetyltransferase
MSAIELRTATPADEGEIRALLRSAGLPADDVATGAQEYVLARDGARLVGTVGLEVVGPDALVRSLAVVPDRRRRGVAHALHERALERARRRGVRALYLLTTTAERYAASKGFERIDRAEVPSGILALPQFRALCPASAVCMRLRLP